MLFMRPSIDWTNVFSELYSYTYKIFFSEYVLAWYLILSLVFIYFLFSIKFSL